MNNFDLEDTGFSLYRVLTVSRRVLKQIVRDRRTFAMILIMPMVVMFIFGVALSGEATDVPILIENQDNGVSTPFGDRNLAENILTEMEGDDRVDISYGNYQNGITGVENGTYHGSIMIPSNFSEALFNVSQGQDIQIKIYLYLDATKPQIKASVLGALQEAISDGLETQVLVVDQEFAHGGVEYSGLETATPAVMSYVLTFLVLLLSLLILIRERIEGTQYRLLATPLSARERLLGYVIALTMFAIVEGASILLISIFLFDVPVRGSIILLIFIVFLYALVNVLLAVFMSNFAQNELQAVQMAVFVALPSLAISGLLIPISSLPGFLQPVAKVVPLTYAVQIFEGILLKGWGLDLLWQEISILIAIGTGLMALAILTVKSHQE